MQREIILTSFKLFLFLLDLFSIVDHATSYIISELSTTIRRNVINVAVKVLAPKFPLCIKNAKSVAMNFKMKTVSRDI